MYSQFASDVDSPAPTVIRPRSLIASTLRSLGGGEDPVELARVRAPRCRAIGYATAGRQHKCATSQPDSRAPGKQRDEPGRRLALSAESDARRRQRRRIMQNTSPAANSIAAMPVPTAMQMIVFVPRRALAEAGLGEARLEVEVEVEVDVDVSDQSQLLPGSQPPENHDV